MFLQVATEHRNNRRRTARREEKGAPTRISHAKVYVGGVTADADRMPQPALSRTAHRNVFALWVLPEEPLAAAWQRGFEGFRTCRRPAGRMNASTADRAGAWLQ